MLAPHVMPRSSPTLAPLAALLLLVFTVAACAAAPQAPAKPPVRELPAPATSLLVRVPLVYGDPNPIALPDDQGSAGAPASFASMMGGAAIHNSVEYIFEHIRVDPPKESARIVGELDEIETKVSGKGFEHSDPLARAAQGVVDEVCRGGPKPTDARKVFARAVGLPSTLLKRMAVPWLGYDLSRDEVSGLHEKVKGGGYTHVGVGVCQGMVDGHPNAVMALALFAGP